MFLVLDLSFSLARSLSIYLSFSLSFSRSRSLSSRARALSVSRSLLLSISLSRPRPRPVPRSRSRSRSRSLLSLSAPLYDTAQAAIFHDQAGCDRAQGQREAFVQGCSQCSYAHITPSASFSTACCTNVRRCCAGELVYVCII